MKTISTKIGRIFVFCHVNTKIIIQIINKFTFTQYLLYDNQLIRRFPFFNHPPLYIILYLEQTWALALFFQIRSPLSAHFNSMDCYRSIAHFADFQVRSSLNRSQRDQWFAPKKTVVCSRSQAVNRLLLCSLGWYS